MHSSLLKGASANRIQEQKQTKAINDIVVFVGSLAISPPGCPANLHFDNRCEHCFSKLHIADLCYTPDHALARSSEIGKER